MRSSLLLAFAAAMLPLTAYAAPRLTPEAQLARELKGRTAGTPVDCISLRHVRSSRIIDDTAIVYETGGTIYVNRPRAGAESLDRWDTLVTRLFARRREIVKDLAAAQNNAPDSIAILHICIINRGHEATAC